MRTPITALAAAVAAAALALLALLPGSTADAAVSIAPAATAPAVEPVSNNCPRTILTERRIDAHATRYSTTYLYWVTARRTCPDGTTETYYYQEWRNS